MSDLGAAARRFTEGDALAFREIVTATSARLVRLAARIMGNVSDGEDVVQEAYMKAHRALSSGQFDGRSSVETWLHRIVTNTAIDALRSRVRHPKGTAAVEHVAWDGSAAMEARFALAELDDMLRDVPADQRTALVLKTVEGMSAKEIADLMETTEGAVEQLLVRARVTLAHWRKGES